MEQDPQVLFDLLREGSKFPGDCGNPADQKPEWLDMKKWQRARDFVDEHFYSVMSAHSAGVYLMSQVPTLVKPLLFTGKSESIAASCRRWADTIHHVYSWYDGDVWDTKDYAHKSIMIIRGRHKKVSQDMNHGGNETQQDSGRHPQVRENKDDVWISQYDMAITQFTFVAAAIVNPDKMGLSTASDDDLDCLIHFWRGIGYLMGIEDRFNICSFGGFRELQPLFRLIVKEVAVATLENPREEFTKLLSTASEGLVFIDPFVSKEAMLNFAYYVVDQPEKYTLDWYGYFCRSVRSLLLYLVQYPGMRKLINSKPLRSVLVNNTTRYMTGGTGCPMTKTSQDGDSIAWSLYQRIRKTLV